MTDQIPEVDVSTDHASTNFYWTFGKQEVFNLQTTVRGIVTTNQIEAHITSVKNALSYIVGIGGHAKPVGRQPDTAVPSNGNGQPAQPPATEAAPVLPDGNPDPGYCTIHKVAMKRHEKDGQVWYSHKDGENWCKGK